MTNRARAPRAAGKLLWFLQMSQNPTYIHICIALPFLNLAFTIWWFYNVTKNLWTPSTLFLVLVIITMESRAPGKSDHIIDRLPGVLDPPQPARLLLPQVLHHELLEGCFQKKAKYNSKDEPVAVCPGFSL